MDPTEIFYAGNRAEWRNWLSENHGTRKDVWLVFPLKASCEESVSYNDAVEEALCFGWIDSTYKSLDPLHGIRRFTPRKNGSPFSRPNIERLIWLDRKGMILPSVRDSVAELLETPYEFPKDIIDALREDDTVWRNFEGFSDSYKRIRVAYVDAARGRPEEFQKRLRNLIDKTKSGKIISGYGGIDKYYRCAFSIGKVRSANTTLLNMIRGC